MATWHEVQTYIRRNYAVRELEDDVLSIVLQLPDNRTHQCFVRPNNDEGTWVEFLAFVAEWSPQNALKALEMNEQIFGVGKFADMVIIRHAQKTDTADEDEIDSGIWGVSIAADALELQITHKDDY